MKVRFFRLMLALALLAIGPAVYAVDASNNDVESIFLNAADDSADSESLPIELDDVDLPKVVKKALPTTAPAVSSHKALTNTTPLTANLDASKPAPEKQNQQIGELKKQNSDLQGRLNQLNEQMAMLRQAIEQSNKMFAASMEAQKNAKLNLLPKTQLQPANLIVEPTPSLISALQTHPKLTGTKSPAPQAKAEPAPAAAPINLSENDIVQGKDSHAALNKDSDAAPKAAEKAPPVVAETHVLSMGDLLKDAHLSATIPAGTADHPLISSDQLDQGSATLLAAAKKVSHYLTRLGIHYLPEDPNVALKFAAAVFAMVLALMIFAAWPTQRKVQKKAQKKLRKQEKLAAILQEKLNRQEQARQQKLEREQQKQQRLLALKQKKELKTLKQNEVLLEKEQQRQREQEEKELKRQILQAQLEQARLDKQAKQEERREKNLKREPEISALPMVEQIPAPVVRQPQSAPTPSTQPEAGMQTIYNIASNSSESFPVKLNLARSCLEKGDYEGVKQALRPVLVKGNKFQREEARILLEEAMTVLEREG